MLRIWSGLTWNIQALGRGLVMLADLLYYNQVEI
jgi:hypothetical protein